MKIFEHDIHVYWYLFIDILWRYMYTRQLSSLYLELFICSFFVINVGFFDWHIYMWSYCDRKPTVCFTFSSLVIFLCFSPHINEFDNNLCKYASLRQSWHCFCLKFCFLNDVLNKTASLVLFIVTMIWYFYYFCDVLMTTFHFCVRPSSYLY